MRGLTAVPMHAACGAIMGWFYGRARFSPPGQRLKPYLLGYLVPVVFHGLYDAPLLTLQEIVEGLGGADPSGDQATLMFGLMAASCVVLLVQLVAAVVLVQRARKEQQTAAVAAGQAVLQPARERSPVLGWLGVLTGGGLASVGGLFLLGALAVLVLQPPMDPGTDPMAAVGGFVILGAPPLLVGLLAFGLGVRSLNRRGAPEVVLVGAPPR